MKHKKMERSKYQIFPPHPLASREALKTSISHRGVEKPTTWDDENNLLDGWERETACAELGITCPREVRHFDTEIEKFQFLLAVNAHRRPCLSSKQKRAIIEAYLQGDPEIADNTLANALGVSKNTVARCRHRLEEAGTIQKADKTRGRDDKLRPVRYAKRIVTNTPGEFKKAQEIIRDLPDTCIGKTVDIRSAKRLSKAARRNHMSRNNPPNTFQQTVGDNQNIITGDVSQLFQMLQNNSVDLFLSDPPYDEPDLFGELARLAAAKLKPGGLLLTYSGQFYLPRILELMGKHLDYWWILSIVQSGPHLAVWPRRINNAWKPILVYSKAPHRNDREMLTDVLSGTGCDKRYHEWGQDAGEAVYLLEKLTLPGDFIVDPFVGGGSTLAACKGISRRWLGTEINPHTAERARQRLRAIVES